MGVILGELLSVVPGLVYWDTPFQICWQLPRKSSFVHLQHRFTTCRQYLKISARQDIVLATMSLYSLDFKAHCFLLSKKAHSDYYMWYRMCNEHLKTVHTRELLESLINCQLRLIAFFKVLTCPVIKLRFINLRLYVCMYVVTYSGTNF